MGDYFPRSYSYRPYIHSWPGKPVNRGTCKHSTARKLRAKARNG